MITRRAALLSAAVLGLSSKFGYAAGQEDWRAALKAAVDNNDPVTLGHIIPPPDDQSWKDVDNIIKGAPSSGQPIKVAEYLVSSIPQKYQMAWPEPNPAKPTYANPLILRFFLATRDKPAGDTTAWCAAFMNFCLQRTGFPRTQSAGSQSFIGWGKPVWSKSDGRMPTAAKEGDIVVFRHRSDPAHGHVAFFKKIDAQYANRIDVLGGNQIEKGIHLIDVKPLRVDSDLELFQIRTMDGLRSA